MVSGPDTRSQQERRAAVGPACHDHLAGRDRASRRRVGRRPPVHPPRRRDATGTSVLTSRFDGRPSSAGRYASAVVTRPPAARAHRHRTGSDRPRGVVVVDGRDADVLQAGDGRFMDRRATQLRIAGDRDRSVGTVPWPVAELRVRLDASEDGQDLVERPTLRTRRRPAVEVGGRTAHGEPGQPGCPADNAATTELLGLGRPDRLRRKSPVGDGRKAPAVASPGGRVLGRSGPASSSSTVRTRGRPGVARARSPPPHRRRSRDRTRGAVPPGPPPARCAPSMRGRWAVLAGQVGRRARLPFCRCRSCDARSWNRSLWWGSSAPRRRSRPPLPPGGTFMDDNGSTFEATSTASPRPASPRAARRRRTARRERHPRPDGGLPRPRPRTDGDGRLAFWTPPGRSPSTSTSWPRPASRRAATHRPTTASALGSR